MTFNDDFYIISSNSSIKNVPTFLSMEFLKELENNDGTLKPHISDLNTNVTYYGKPAIKCTIPTLFISIEYKDSNKDVFLIEHEVFLYEEDYPTLKDLETYKEKFSYGFASQVTQEIKDIVEAFHNGYGCIQLNSGDY